MEIQEFKQIYFVNTIKPRQINHLDESNNHGLDDERGDYILTSHDHIMYRFEVT